MPMGGSRAAHREQQVGDCGRSTLEFGARRRNGKTPFEVLVHYGQKTGRECDSKAMAAITFLLALCWS